MLEIHLASMRARDKWVLLGFCVWWWWCWHVGDLGIKVVHMLVSSCNWGLDTFGWPSFLSQKVEVGDNWRIVSLTVSHKRQSNEREFTIEVSLVANFCTLQECNRGVYKEGFEQWIFGMFHSNWNERVWHTATRRVDTH